MRLSLIRRPVAVWTLALALSVAGVFAVLRMPKEITPSVDYPRLTVTAIYPGMSPQVVENDVTSQIESEISTIPGIRKISSFSNTGYSQISLELESKANPDYIRFVVQEHLAFLMDRLPEQVRPPSVSAYIPEEMSTSQFMSYNILGSWNDAQLKEYAEKRLIPMLEGIPGVSNVEVVGGREHQILIALDQQSMKRFQLNENHIYSLIQDRVAEIHCGRLISQGQRRTVLISESARSLWDIRQLPLGMAGGRMLKLEDVATVTDTLSPAGSFIRINGRNSLLLILEREPNYNTIKVVDQVMEVVAALQSGLPEGMELRLEDDQSRVIRENIRTFAYRSVFSFLIIFLVLLMFLSHLSTAFQVQFSIIISALATLLLMFIFNYSLNLITLGGLALGFGILVDNSIVVAENIHRYRQQGLSPEEACSTGVGEIAMPVIASTMTTLAVLFPFLYLMEELKIYYLPFAVTVSLSLIFSLLISFLFIPTAVYQSLKKQTKSDSIPNRNSTISDERDQENGRPEDELPSDRATTQGGIQAGNRTELVAAALDSGEPIPPDHDTPRANRVSRGLQWLYTRIMTHVLRRPRLTILLAVWMFGLPVWLLPAGISSPTDLKRSPLKSSLILTYNRVMEFSWIKAIRPALNFGLGGSSYLFYRYVSRGEIWKWGEETYIEVMVILPPGSDIEEMDKVVRRIESTLAAEEGIKEYRARLNATYARMEVRFTPENQLTAIPYIIKEKLIIQATRIGNAVIRVNGYGDGFSSGGGGVSINNRLLLSGYNYRRLEELADNIKRALEVYPRVQNIRTDQTRRGYGWSTSQETSLRLNRAGMMQRQFTASDVIRGLRPYLTGSNYRQRIRLGSEEVPFVIQSHDYADFQFYQLDPLVIRNLYRRESRLGELADIRLLDVQPMIEREDQRYFKVVVFDYLAPGDYTQRFIKRFVPTVDLPPGYSLETLGWSFFDDEKKSSTWWVAGLALLLMYMVLAGLYESFSYPLMVFLIIPLSLIGVMMTFYLTDTTFNQSAYIGVILLLGIVVNNAIIFLDHIRLLRRRGGFDCLEDLLIRAGSDRLRPIIMTTLTTIAGLMPMIITGDKSRDDLWYTLSLTTIGGLTTSVALGLIVLPACVLWLEKRRASRAVHSVS
ncbi:MAG: efflux RND transporter permease subunit [Candidatus Delongbacteria bacterium]|nr:efflux RND transporter permease subunit [Candidatus Delongbacteria bacterium]